MRLTTLARRSARCHVEGLELRLMMSGSVDIQGTKPAAVDQPRINVLLRRSADGPPLEGIDFFGDPTYNISGYLDTGGGGNILSPEDTENFGVAAETVDGQPVIFNDVGVGGGQAFGVSEVLYASLAPFTPDADINDPGSFATVYNQSAGPLRLQLSDTPSPFGALAPLNVFGMPVMVGKVAVFDPKPVTTFGQTMSTYLYQPGTPFRPDTADSNPGIPPTNLHVTLSYGDFSRFTEVMPEGAPGPTLYKNPFIGPDPTRQLNPNPPPDDTPGVTLTRGSMSSSGSFLLDTGGQSSFLSRARAADLDVFYAPGTYQTNRARLVDGNGNTIPNQFSVPIQGVGGIVNLSGFYADSMTLPTTEGRDVRYLGAPVLVVDVDIVDPRTNESITLDGTVGMNFLSTSMNVDGSGATYTPFDWVVFDEPDGALGLQIPVSVAGRHLFYNHSAFDGSDPAANAADDGAVATDKRALLPNRRATFANYSSYDKGINGVMVDIDGLPTGVTLTPNDFAFRTGTTGSPSTWSAGPTPRSVSVRRGAGDNGSDRVTLVWDDYNSPAAARDRRAVANAWLQVTVKANGNTGLEVPDVFYVGNLIAETGDSTRSAVANAMDTLAVRRHTSAANATIDNKWDINRDGRVNALDLAIARAQTPRHSLPLITGVSTVASSSLSADKITAAVLTPASDRRDEQSA